VSEFESDLDRGRKEGHIDALLVQHTKRLSAISDCVDKLSGAVSELGETLRTGLLDLASSIRTLQEEGRLAEERVKVAAVTLATETERRREELAQSLASGDRKWTKRQQLLALALSSVLALCAVVGVYFATH
jgi:hypothetical protein